MSLALICAGQGTLHAQMFHNLAEEPAAQPALEMTAHLAGLETPQLLRGFDEAWAQENRTSQLLVVGHALAAYAALEEKGLQADLYAGYSVGEIAATGCAGAWTETTALELTVARAECMDRACVEAGRPLGLLSLIGISIDECERLATAHSCAVSIVNGPDHVVIGGAADDISAVEAQAPGLGAKTVRRVPVSVASHTLFMQPAVKPFADLLRVSDWRLPQSIVLSAIDGRPILQKEMMANSLSRQIAERLNWWECLQSLVEHGACVFLEIGPGRSLTRMVNALFPDLPARAFEDFRSAAGAVKWVRRHRL